MASQSSESDPERCNAVTRALLKEFKQYQNVGAADLNGELICSGLSGRADIADRDYFKIALATNSFAEGTYQVGGTAELPSISYAYPVRNPSGTTFAIMFATVDLSWFNRGLAKISLPSGSTVTLFDRTGVALARFPEPADFVGKSFSDSDLLSHTRAGAGNTFEANGLDGKRRFYAYTLVGEDTQPALLAVGLPESTLYSEADANLRRGVIS